MAILKKEVITLNNRLALWLAAGTFAFSLAFAGCQKKEEPVPAANPAPSAPAAGAPAGAGDVAAAPAGGTSPTTPAATADTKTAEKNEEGIKK